jgi:branched-chain amino acid transport system permease protein
VTTLLQLTFAGLSLGSIYALISLGWTVLFQVAKVYNLAQGGFVVVSALSYIHFTRDRDWPIPVAMLGSLGLCLVLGLVLCKIVLNARTTKSEVGPIVMTIGAAIVISESLRSIWGVDPRVAKAFLPTEPIRVFGATVLPHSLLLWGGTAVMFFLGWLIFERTLLGKALRACSESSTAAALVGINPQRTHLVAFALAALFGGVGGILLAPLIAVSWDQVIPLGIYGFIGAIIGRWRYLPSAFGSVALGLVASYAGGYISSEWQTSVVYLALLAALLTTRQRRAGTVTFAQRLVKRLPVARRSAVAEATPAA